MTQRVIPEHLSSLFISSCTLTRDCTQLYSINRVLSIEHLSTVSALHRFFESRGSFFRSRWASPPRFNLVVYWVEPITILKAPNSTGQPACLEEQKSSSPESTHPVQMAGPHTRRNAGGAPIDNSGTPKSTPAVSRASTLAPV